MATKNPVFFSPKKTHPGAFESRYSNFRGEKKTNKPSENHGYLLGLEFSGLSITRFVAFSRCPGEQGAGHLSGLASREQGNEAMVMMMEITISGVVSNHCHHLPSLAIWPDFFFRSPHVFFCMDFTPLHFFKND